MDKTEILMVILYIIELATIAIFYNLYKHWKAKHDKAVDVWSTECNRKDKLIEKLENELNTYKTLEDVVHVEKFVVDPLVFNIKLDIDRDVFDSIDSFKSFCLDQVARHISEALKKNDNLYQLMYDQNPRLMRDNVIIRVRLTPFKEDADWSRVPIRHHEPLVVLNPATDISVL